MGSEGIITVAAKSWLQDKNVTVNAATVVTAGTTVMWSGGIWTSTDK